MWKTGVSRLGNACPSGSTFFMVQESLSGHIGTFDKKNKVVSIETLTIEGCECKSLNDLHHLFNIGDLEQLMHHVEQNLAYYKSNHQKSTT